MKNPFIPEHPYHYLNDAEDGYACRAPFAIDTRGTRIKHAVTCDRCLVAMVRDHAGNRDCEPLRLGYIVELPTGGILGEEGSASVYETAEVAASAAERRGYVVGTLIRPIRTARKRMPT